jgi:hypothetical protein
MSGVYNETYFSSRPDEAASPGLLYCVVLINKKTFARECIKIGITKGTSYKAVLKRSAGFSGYETRILKTYEDTLYNVWALEQELHKKFQHLKYTPTAKFGGHTECFTFDSAIIKSIPNKQR